MTSDTVPDRLDQLIRAADPAAGRPAPAVDDSPLALAAVRGGLTPPAHLARPDPDDAAPGTVPVGDAGTGGSPVGWGPDPAGRRAGGWVPVAASVVAVVAVVGLAAAVSGAGPLGSGGPAGSARTTAPGPGGGAEPGGGDHTASSGPDYERAERLLAALQDAVPAGYTVPAGGTGHPGGPGPTVGPDGSAMPAAYFQAVREEGPYEGYQGYEYLADTIVSEGPRVGSLAVRVWKGVPDWSADPCVVVNRIYWSTGARCEAVQTAGGSTVAVVDGEAGPPGGTDRRETQWAGLRRPDGTVVLVSQGWGVLNERIPGLSRPVFDRAALAALA
ncbi:MAG TPA: hypothetical protein VE547_20705, partial [Mycobacteriales bacterium]|nr:hypothetical protein [Mycobacteriales bacterium]